MLNEVKVGETIFEKHSMTKVSVIRKNETSKGFKLDECMFADKELAQIFVEACKERGIDAGTNIWTWTTLIEKSM